MSDINHQNSGTVPLRPKKDSKRSQKRRNRRWDSLEKSSRKHRRAASRLYKNSDSSTKNKGKLNYHS